MKLARSRKELEKQLQEMNKILKEANIKVLSCEEENAELKAKLALYDNKEGMKQKIEELSAQLLEKESLLAVAWEEVKGKDSLLENSIKALQKMMEERCFIFEQSLKLKAQLDSNENLKMGNESNLKFIISQKDQEFQQIKVENNRLAEIIFKHEGFKTHYEE